MAGTTLITELLERRELIANFVSRNLKQRYKGSFFGFFWSLLHPLFLVLVYLVFIRLMRFEMDLPYLIVGVLVWQFFALACGDAVGIIYGHSTLVKKTYFPRIILPLAAVLGNLIHFLLSLVILLFFLFAFKLWPGIQYVHLLWLVALQFVFCLGMALLLSSLNVFYRDVEHLLQIVIMAWFFITPIIYPLSNIVDNPALPGFVLKLYFFNPLASLVQLYRQVFIGSPPPGVPLWPGLVVAIVIFLVGYATFVKLEPRFADEL
jgi:ABC-type polysaccharide/polyol phosphate export permease